MGRAGWISLLRGLSSSKNKPSMVRPVIVSSAKVSLSESVRTGDGKTWCCGQLPHLGPGTGNHLEPGPTRKGLTGRTGWTGQTRCSDWRNPPPGFSSDPAASTSVFPLAPGSQPPPSCPDNERSQLSDSSLSPSLPISPTLPPLVSLSTVSRARATCRKASSRLCFSPRLSLPSSSPSILAS